MECSFVHFWYKLWKDNMMCASGSHYWLHDSPLTIFGKTWQKAWCTFRTWETITSVVCRVFFVDSKQFGMADADINRQPLWFESSTQTHAHVLVCFWCDYWSSVVKELWCDRGRCLYEPERTRRWLHASHGPPAQPMFQMVQNDQHENINTKTHLKAPQVRTVQSDYTSKTSWIKHSNSLSF